MAKKPRVLQDKHLHVAPVVGDEPVRRSETAPLAEYLAEPVAWPTWLRAAPILGAALLAVASTTANNPTQPTVVQGALLVSLLALAAGVLHWLRPNLTLAVMGALAGLLAAGLLVAGGPAVVQLGEPLRATLGGFSALLLTGMAAGSLLALGAGGGKRLRALAGLALLGPTLFTWMPQGFSGKTPLPVIAALTGIEVAVTAGQPAALTPLPGATWLLLLGVLAPLLLVALLLKKLDEKLSIAAAGLLLVPLLGWALQAGPWWPLLVLATPLVAVAALLPLLRDDDATLDLAWQRAWEPGLVTLLLAAYVVLKANALRYSTTDEALYFYAAKLWSEGTLPYRDFFFSHPPLHLAIPALLYKVFGYHFLIGKCLSAGAALVAALFGWRLARRWLGPLGAVVALALNLLACEVLQASSNLTGINLSTAWLLAGLWAALGHGRFVLGGMLIGAAASTGFYAVGGAVALAVMGATMPRSLRQGQPWWHHPSVRVLLGFLAVWGSINLVFSSIGGPGYNAGVYAYHFAKKAKVEGFTPLSDSPLAIFSNFFAMLGSRDFLIDLYYHTAHWWWALGLPIAASLRAKVEGRSLADVFDPRRWWQVPASRPLLMWAIAWALLIEFGSFKERYDFYFALILPAASLAAAAFVVDSAHVAWALLRGSTSSSQRFAAVACAALLLWGGSWMSVGMAANRKAYPTEFGGAKVEGKGPGERLDFEWLDSPGPAWVSSWTKALFWQGYRIRGSVETGVHHYLWGKKRWFSKAEEMATWIRNHSQEGDTVSGASDYAPLLALLSGRRMAGNHVDTNSKVFNTGTVAVEKFWEEACKDHLKFLVIAPQSYFAAADLAKRPTVGAWFRQDKVFSDPALKHWRNQDMELWVRKSDEPCRFVATAGPVAPPTSDQ